MAPEVQLNGQNLLFALQILWLRGIFLQHVFMALRSETKCVSSQQPLHLILFHCTIA